ncbi:hypothetical protein [Massilia sp. YIM B02443]|uniref:hypothetical protein n=1 Tax=Massilia sp. YIM B02443 TaxID=3050127 RepID=UPI0025B6356F|nr:hypothetical protein [Massilia sp. YIM B02443]MDN4039593.1 hypothetical protein [Massilia sp. YIM B02443]
MQGVEHYPPLRMVRQRELREQLLQPRRLHDPLLSTTMGVGRLIISAVQSSSISNADSATNQVQTGARTTGLEARKILKFLVQSRNFAVFAVFTDPLTELPETQLAYNNKATMESSR